MTDRMEVETFDEDTAEKFADADVPRLPPMLFPMNGMRFDALQGDSLGLGHFPNTTGDPHDLAIITAKKVDNIEDADGLALIMLLTADSARSLAANLITAANKSDEKRGKTNGH